MKTRERRSKAINIILWIAQGFLALMFCWSGFMKIFQPEQLPFPWVKDNPSLAFITGIVDLLAGIGIVLPTLVGIRPKLAILSAYGIITLMIAASIFHVSREETGDIGFNIFIALLALFIAWGRQANAPATF